MRNPCRSSFFFPLLLVLAAVLCGSPGGLVAQSATGAMGGTVLDSGGGPVPGATVTARHAATGTSRTGVTNAAGAFAFPLLPVGRYDVTAALAGFAPATTRDVAVSVGGDVTLRLTLGLAGVAQTVTVSAEAPLVETTRSQVSSVVGERSIGTLPTNGRNFIDFVLTTPGVVKDVRQGDISFAGQRGTLNSLVVDGADNNNTFFGQALGRTGSGRAPYQFSQDAVQEFQVNSNAYSAEYGRAGGAVINVVTKSGTNELHGAAFFFLRDKGLNRNDYVNEINNRPKGPYDYKQFGASLGGPVLKDRVFFFANYDGQRNTQPNTVVLGLPANVPSDPDTQAGLASLRELGESWDRRQDQDVFFLKGDAEVGGRGGRISLRYNRQEFTGKNFESGGITNAAEHTGNSLVNTDTLSASFTGSFSSVFANELRGQWARDREPGLANSDKPEATVREGGQTVLVVGRNFFSPRETTITRYQVADTATLLFAKHTVKAGFDFNRDLILNYFPGNFSGAYTFGSLASWHRGRPSGSGERYVQAFAGEGTTGPYTNPDLSEIGLFVQDEFRPLADLTVNVGVRYDRQGIAQPRVQNPDGQLLAAGIDTSRIAEDDNVGVRVGFAWTPKGSDRTVVRGGYGMFYGRTPSIMIGTAHSNNGINVQTITFTGSQVPTYPNTFASLPTGIALPKPTIFYFPDDFRSPFLQQASLGFERGLTADLSVGLSYLHVKGEDLPRSADVNVGTAVDTPFTLAAGGTVNVRRYPNERPFTNFARVIAFQSSAESNYNGLTVDLVKRFSHHWQGRVAYTWGKVLDTKPDATAVVPQGSDDAKFAQDPKDLDGDYAPGDNDVRHRVVLSWLWDLDYTKEGSSAVTRALLGGWSFSGIFSYSTGQPYSAIVNSDLNNDGNTRNDRAPGFGRNTERLPAQVSFDPRLTKEIPLGPVRLQLIAEAFNLFNRSNVSIVNNTYYSLVSGRLVAQSTYRRPTASTGPRIVQLAAKVIF